MRQRCKAEEEEYVITPKGLFFIALMKVHLITSCDDWQSELAWELFVDDMKKHGYITREN